MPQAILDANQRAAHGSNLTTSGYTHHEVIARTGVPANSSSFVWWPSEVGPSGRTVFKQLLTSSFALLFCASASLAQANPDAACATCHQQIVASFEQTTMARGSGAALAGLIQGGFRHIPSSIDYRVFLRDSAAFLSYDRAATPGQPALHGEQRLLYFVGSGKRGRTYLYQQPAGNDAQWFEAPINYYTRKALWDMAPNFGASQSMPSSLPVDANCLHCHATAVATALPGARNRFAGAPFQQGGIGCIACHGDPAAHLAAKGHGPIVNPAKLTASRRDSTCLQCHLEGDAAVFRANTSPADFRAGDDLDTRAVYFVKAASKANRAASQWEALLRSACKAGVAATAGSPAKPGAGDALTCTTCHDPHSSPPESQRVAFYRAKCLACHTGPVIATQHYPAQQDCATCHMPTRDTTDISHNQSTDHNIQRAPVAASLRFASLAESTELLPVGHATVTGRDLGLAYAQLAERGDRFSAPKALALLTKAEAVGQSDTPVHVQLGFLHQRAGDLAPARAEYKAALALDPLEPTALANLAVLDASTGSPAEAIQLLQRVAAADPTQTAAGLNLAFIQCRLGDIAKALATLQTLSLYAPDDPILRRFLTTGTYAEQTCPLR